jgi:hypothetical protein
VFRPFGGSLGGAEEAQSHRVRYWEIIADNLSKACWSWGCASALDSNGRTIWIVDAHRGGGKRFVERADENLTARLSNWSRRRRGLTSISGTFG